MNAVTQSRLEALQGHRTLYEVALISPDGRKWVVSYTDRSGAKLRRAVGRCAVRIAATIGNRDVLMLRAPKDALELSGGWAVRFTGRTEREAITEGVLPLLAEGAQ